MNEADLRAAVAKRRNVQDNTWELMRDLGFVEEAAGGFGEAEDDPVGYLVSYFDQIADGSPLRGRSSRQKGRAQEGERIPPQLTEYEIQRSELFSEYVASQAASGAKGFRVKHLGDRLLSPKQARELLTSPVAAHWPRFAFETLGVSVVGHTYRLTEGMSDKRGPYSLIEVPLPSSNFEPISDRRPLPSGPWEIPTNREDARSNRKLRRESETPTGSWKILVFPGEDGTAHRVLVRSKSVLGKLHYEVSRLIRRYPWDEAEATWFVLTGETPWVAPLTWQFQGTGAGPDLWNYGFITLKVEPWVSARVVKAIYSDVQHKLLGKDNKQVGEKNRELFRFVVSRMKPDGSLPKARMLVEQWDQEYPQWHYGHRDTDQVRRFRRDFNLVRRLLATPEYELRDDD